MPREEYEVYTREERSPSREYRRARVQIPDEENPPKGDYIVRVVAVQLLVCTLIVLTVFGLYKSGSQRFTQLRDTYTSMFSKDMDSAEFKAALKRVSAFVFQPSVSGDTEKPNAGETQDAESPTDAEDAALTGAGGEDLLYPADKASFAPLTVAGAFTVPVEYTRLTSKFGYRINPVTDAYGFHGGLDMAAPEGTPIYAAFTGTVTKVDKSDARGNYIILSHGNGLETVYCHCSAIVAKEGENIRNGEVIAKVGSTGQATGPHLHWEIRMRDVRYDPAWILGLHVSDG